MRIIELFSYVLTVIIKVNIIRTAFQNLYTLVLMRNGGNEKERKGG